MTQNEKPAAGRAAGFERDAASGRNLHSQNSHLIAKINFALTATISFAPRSSSPAPLRPVPMRTSAKRPALRGWREATSLDADAVAATFQTARYADGLAIATGGGVFVVDLDRGHARDVDGVASFEEYDRAPRRRQTWRLARAWNAERRGASLLRLTARPARSESHRARAGR